MQPSTLSRVVSASSTAIVTLPEKSLTRHEPHVPERHALSIKTSAPSAASRIVSSARTGAVVCDVRKTTFPAISLEALPFAVGLRLTVPKASVFISTLGTPRSRSAAFIASIISAGPQMCTLRRAMSDTVDASNAASMTHWPRPRFRARFAHGYCHAEIRILALQLGYLVTKNEVKRRPKAEDQGNLAAPGLLGEVAYDAHHGSDTDTTTDQHHTFRLFSSENKTPIRRLEADFLPELELVMQPARNQAVILALDGDLDAVTPRRR